MKFSVPKANRHSRMLRTVIALSYLVLVVFALITALKSLSEDFDGLNFIMQIPLALPWALFPGVIIFPLLGPNYVAWAWILAAFGVVNSAIIFFKLVRPRQEAGVQEAED